MNSYMIEYATYVLAVVSLAFFNIGVLDGKEGVRYSGEIFALLMSPLLLALAGAVAMATNTITALYGSELPISSSTVDAGLVLQLFAAMACMIIAYDVGYTVGDAAFNKGRRPGYVWRLARALAGARPERSRAEPRRAVARAAPLAAGRLRSAYVDSRGKLVLEVE